MTSTKQPIQGKQMLILFAAALGLCCGFGALYFSTIPIFLKPLATQFGWGRGETAAATALAMLGQAVGGVLIGRMIDFLGASFSIGLSILGLAVFTALMSQQNGKLIMFASVSFFVGLIAVATTALGYITVLTRWFEQRLGLAMGVAMLGFGLGTVLFPILTQSLITQYGWRTAYLGLAAFAFIMGAISWVLLFVVAGAQSTEHLIATDQKRIAELPGITLGQAVGSMRYWFTALIIFLVSAASLGIAVHLSALLTDRGMTAQIAARMLAVTGLGIVLGRLLAGALLDKYSAAMVGGCAFAMGAAGIALVGLAPAGMMWITTVGCFLVAFAIGAEGDFIPFVVKRYFGVRNFGSIYGTLFAIFALGGIAGPVLFGLSFDKLASYSPAALGASVACAIAAVFTFFLGPYKYQAQPMN